MAQLLPLLADYDSGMAVELPCPLLRVGEGTVHRPWNQPWVNRQVLVGAHIDENGGIWRAEQPRELFNGDGVDRRHDASSMLVGRDASACRLMGRSHSPDSNQVADHKWLSRFIGQLYRARRSCETRYLYANERAE